jgi:ribose 5-phosphate isomerase A
MKEIVAEEIARRVKPGELLGVGTGSTVDLALLKIGERVKKEKLILQIVPSSIETAWRGQELGLTVMYPGFCADIPWGFDGADAVDSSLRVIKGGGGAMLQEKILAARCKEYVIIVDESKFTQDLAAVAIPVEIVPEARLIVERGLRSLGAQSLELRTGKGKHGPVLTEAGNIILDVRFKEIRSSLADSIKSQVGVVEHGLFEDFATEVLIGTRDGLKTLRRP